MKIGDRVYVHGYVDEIRKDTVIIRNEGGYFGTAKNEIVEAQKAEDIVSVIRCKDCLWKEETRGLHKWCNKNSLGTTDDDFCSWAERKEENG